MPNWEAEIIGRYSFAQSAHCDDCVWVRGPDAATPEAAQAHAIATGHLVVTQELHRALYRRREGSLDESDPQPVSGGNAERGPDGL